MGVMGVCLLLTGRSWERHERVDSPRSGDLEHSNKGHFFPHSGKNSSTELRGFCQGFSNLEEWRFVLC